MTASDLLSDTAVVVVAAGRGERFGGGKARIRLAGEELWRRAHRLFSDLGLARVVIVGDVPGGVPGGARRRDSVAAGLRLIDDAEFVLVHDVARPLVTPEVVERVLVRLHRNDVDAVVPGVAVADTITRHAGEVITGTLDRRELAAVQTPQGFRVDALLRAHRAHPDVDATDDAGLVELAGGSVVLVEGDPDNFKITWPGDLARAEATLEGRSRG